MMNKHFFKILVLFIGMILVGVVGLFIANYLEESKTNAGASGSHSLL